MDDHSFTYQSPSGGTQSGDGGTQSPDSGYQSDDVNVLPRAIRASRDRFYQQGPNGPVIAKEEISFDLQLEDQPGVSVATLKLDTMTYNLADELAPLDLLQDLDISQIRFNLRNCITYRAVVLLILVLMITARNLNLPWYRRSHISI